jgi:hypothetical protein
MKTILIAFSLIIGSISAIYGVFDGNHHISLSAGFGAVPGIFPVSQIEYKTPHFFLLSIGVRAKLFAYESAYLYTRSFYEIPITIEMTLLPMRNRFTLFAGGGAMITLYPDNPLSDSIHPLVVLGVTKRWKLSKLETPVVMGFEKNQLSLSVIPRFDLEILKWFGVFVSVNGDLSIPFDSPAQFGIRTLVGVNFRI